jgi:hypothetical protein
MNKVVVEEKKPPTLYGSTFFTVCHIFLLWLCHTRNLIHILVAKNLQSPPTLKTEWKKCWSDNRFAVNEVKNIQHRVKTNKLLIVWFFSQPFSMS